MIEKTSDIATVFGDAYSMSAPKVLGDQHNYLLNTLEKDLASRTHPVLLVLGPGGQVLPYSCQYTKDGQLGHSNRDRIKKMLKNGKIIFLDYIANESKGGLEKGLKTLQAMGFFDKEYFSVGCFNPDGILVPKRQSDGSISFLVNNLRDSLKLSDQSVDVVDANLSIHHASITRSELERIYTEIFRVLKHGALLHLGEGNTDMNYNENKLIRIGQDLSSMINSAVLVADEREKGAGYMAYSFFENGKQYNHLPILGKERLSAKNNYAYVRITEEGFVVLKANKPDEMMLQENKSIEIAHLLKNRGYKQMFIFEDSISMPLIDPKMPEDIEGQIKPVDRYYDAIRNRVTQGYGGVDDKLVAQINAGIEFERGNARRGVVEYYMGENQIVKTLEKVGFADITVKHHQTEPFYNITAKKP